LPGLPELIGFAYGLKHQRAELMISHCGRDLNKEWLPYMENQNLASQTEFKIKIMNMALQILDALVLLHKVGFCHWDLKLDNICFSDGRYYLIDFAFSQRINPEHKRKITEFKGNSMFASIRKFQINPKAAPIDDIESLFYLVAFCLDGFYLPWLQDYINQDSTE
jgi:serine/threonine protein kinase